MKIEAAIYNGFTNLKIEGHSKVIIDCYNKRSSSLNSIILLIEDVWRLSQDLNIYNCDHIYREVNRIIVVLQISNIWCSNFPRDVIKFCFKDYYDLSFNCMCKFPYL